ncbi:uncharacterized protein K489DRAFT_158902 [Dissoconium aciculare CBS 342.82]|uniref:Uncharacterized protein n=1 Tax=Dissoconium aciculare CBS 342.82 TaxID=1314786 RepID=A0A6J3MD16_9PEZI|nr:uncharacterized protein K489DRAFT_158902 [Dissoconium aciculare CBS 342.82]KAF1825484.1 hypothetical protein K489DRAFT_158902 [Dissoconium aciculare CBS 342.82]
MKFTASALTTLALISQAAAKFCAFDTLLGLGTSTFDLPYNFHLLTRGENGTTYPVVSAPVPEGGSFFFSLFIGSKNIPLDDPSVPTFTMQGGTAYANGGRVTASEGISLLAPIPLYVAADNRQYVQGFAAVNVTCDGKPELSLRFTNLLPIPLAPASVNGTLAPGSAVLTPIVDSLLTLYNPIDLIVVPIKPKDQSVRRRRAFVA